MVIKTGRGVVHYMQEHMPDFLNCGYHGLRLVYTVSQKNVAYLMFYNVKKLELKIIVFGT